jgi:hypothetical protein
MQQVTILNNSSNIKFNIRTIDNGNTFSKILFDVIQKTKMRNIIYYDKNQDGQVAKRLADKFIILPENIDKEYLENLINPYYTKKS